MNPVVSFCLPSFRKEILASLETNFAEEKAISRMYARPLPGTVSFSFKNEKPFLFRPRPFLEEQTKDIKNKEDKLNALDKKAISLLLKSFSEEKSIPPLLFAVEPEAEKDISKSLLLYSLSIKKVEEALRDLFFLVQLKSAVEK